MKTTTKFNFKTFSVFVLSVLLCFTLAFSAACSDSGNSSSSSSAAETVKNPSDTQLVSNGDFEFSTFAEDTKFPVSSSVSWSLSRDSKNSTSAISSSGNSGIIDTAATAEKYAEAAEKAKLPKINDEYYNPGSVYSYNLKSDSEYFVYDKEENNANEDKLPMKGSKVLMISNVTAKSETPDEFTGTAQKFTSTSSLSLGQNEYGRISVWIKTKDLRFRFNQTGVGAYIAIQNTVSSSCDPFIIKGIDTEKNGESQWVKYTVYLRSSDFSTSSFKVTLGLGFGNKELREEYVEGYAFFDDVHFEKIEYADYIAGVSATASENVFNLYERNADDTYSKVTADDLKTVAENAYGANNSAESGTKYDEVVYSLSHYRANDSLDMFASFTGDMDATKGSAGVASASEIKNVISADLKAPFGNDFTSDTFYAKLDKAGKYEMETRAFTLEHGSYKKISFWVKVHLDRASRPGLNIEVKDLGNGTTVTTKSTSLASDLDTDKTETFNGWIQYNVYLSNTVVNSEITRKYSVKFTFGDESDDVWEMAMGYFLVTDAQECELTENDYSIASTATNAAQVSLTADMPNGGAADDSSDSYYFGYNASSATLIDKNAAVSVNGYTGVYYDAQKTALTVGSKSGVTAGVINTKNFTSADAYEFLTTEEKAAISALGKLDENDYLQPLVIKSGGASYGYFGSDVTLAANTTTLLKVKVKAIGNAQANVYLVKSDALDGYPVLSLSAKDYQQTADGGYEELDDYKVNEQFVTTVTSSDCARTEITDDGWFTVMFVVTTGNESITVRPELWNGKRGQETTASGTVLFDKFEQTNVTAEAFETEELQTYYGDVVNESSVKKYTRFPTKVITTEDGKEVVNYKTYKESTVFSVYTKTKAIIASYETVNAEREIDNTVSDDDTSSEESSSGMSTDFSWALQISSIIIAALLIVLLAVVLIRMLVKKAKSGKVATKEYYNRDSRDRLNARLESEKNEETEQAEVKPYDYDNPENNLQQQESETAPQTTEEVAPVEEVSENQEQSAKETAETAVNEQPATEETAADETQKQ